MEIRPSLRTPRPEPMPHIHVIPGSTPRPDFPPQPLPERDPKPERVGVKELPEEPKTAPLRSPFSPN
jgi:hypothetical protein